MGAARKTRGMRKRKAAVGVPPPRDRPSGWEFPFERSDMVSWYNPLGIIRTAVRVLFSDLIASYVDSREMQANLPRVALRSGDAIEPPHRPQDAPLDASYAHFSRPGQPGVWIDYVADLGDGWDATYTVAMSVGQEDLDIRGLKNPLPRADILVLGGDNVYPTPSNEEYQNRLLGPYDAALPELPQADRNRPPSLFAIPGNHDWYDGLTAFLRIFCNGSAVGVWRTRQTHSYFAVDLPGGWALWGADIQLQTRIDRPQLDYFARVAEKLRASEARPRRLILCVPLPAWLGADRAELKIAHDNYWFLENRAIEAHCHPWVTLAGDLHHYTRYADGHRRQFITAGGGGSYIQGTHHLPDSVQPPDDAAPYVTPGPRGLFRARSRNHQDAYRESGYAFPRRTESRRLASRVLAFPFMGRNWTFPLLLLGPVYLLLAWAMRDDVAQSVGSRVAALLTRVAGQAFRMEDLLSYVTLVVDRLAQRPIAAVIPLTLLLGFAAFCPMSEPSRPRWAKWAWGLGHGVAQVALAFGSIWALATVVQLRLDGVALTWRAAWWLLAVAVVGGLPGSLLLGLYLLLSNRWFGWHTNEVFAAQTIPDYRCFLRILVRQDGRLEIYPIGIRYVPRRWRRRLDWRPGLSRFESAEDPPRAELIEGPIIIPPGRPGAGP